MNLNISAIALAISGLVVLSGSVIAKEETADVVLMVQLIQAEAQD